MRPEELDDLVAEQAAQQQVLLMALRRLAALTRATNRDPAVFAKRWREIGYSGIDAVPLGVAAGHEAVVREKAKARLDELIDVGFQ